jgi:hypothetical protein
MQVRTTVVSTPTPDSAIIVAGPKTLTMERYFMEHYGYVVEYPDAVLDRLNEEHGVLDFSRSARKPKVGGDDPHHPKPLLRHLQHGRRSQWRPQRCRRNRLVGRRARRNHLAPPDAESTGRVTAALAPDTACAGACRIRPMSASDIAGA